MILFRILLHRNKLLYLDRKQEEQQKELCYIELEGEDRFSNYALYCFPFIGFIGTDLLLIIYIICLTDLINRSFASQKCQLVLSVYSKS